MKHFFKRGAAAIILMGMILGCGKSVDGQLTLQLVSGCDSTAYDAMVKDIDQYCVLVVYTKSGTNSEVTYTTSCSKQIEKAQLGVDVKKLIQDVGSDAVVQVVVEGLVGQVIKARGESAPVTLDPNKDNTISVPFFKVVTLPSNGTASWVGDEFMPIYGAGMKAADGSTTACLDLPYPALQHTATVVNESGQVLVVGGNINKTTAAFLIDTYTNNVSPIDNTILLRYQHTASLLSNGKVVIVGGTTCSPCLTTFCQSCSDPLPVNVIVVDGSSLSVTIVSSMSKSHIGHDSAVLQGSQILVNDGANPAVLLSGDTLSESGITVTVLPPATSADNPLDPAKATTATVLPTTAVYNSVIYGVNTGILQQGSTTATNTNFTFEKSSSPTPTSRAHPLGVKLSTPGALFFGGLPLNSTDPQVIYVAKEPIWTSCGQKNQTAFPTEGYTATLLSNGYIFVAGGTSTQTTSTFVPGSTFYLVPNSNLSNCPSNGNGNFTIYKGPPMLMPRTGHTASLLPDGRLLLVGGKSAVKSPTPTLADHKIVASSAEVIVLK